MLTIFEQYARKLQLMSRNKCSWVFKNTTQGHLKNHGKDSPQVTTLFFLIQLRQRRIASLQSTGRPQRKIGGINKPNVQLLTILAVLRPRTVPANAKKIGVTTLALLEIHMESALSAWRDGAAGSKLFGLGPGYQ